MAEPAEGSTTSPALILYTTNCIITPKPTYLGNIYTAAEVGWPETKHIAADAAGNETSAR